MNKKTILSVKTDLDIQNIAALANEIWHQHYVPIIGKAQVDYMVEKFQSFPAICSQIKNDGYEYFQIFVGDVLAGYIGIQTEKNHLFLSKLYLKKDFRGMGLSRLAVTFLINLCKERGLGCIRLTCNIHNQDTLTAYDHLGFKIVKSAVADIGNGFVMDDYILELKI